MLQPLIEAAARVWAVQVTALDTALNLPSLYTLAEHAGCVALAA